MHVQSLALFSGLGSSVVVSCGVGHRRGSDLALLWLWCRPATVTPIQPLAWELPYAMGALESKKKISQTQRNLCSMVSLVKLYIARTWKEKRKQLWAWNFFLCQNMKKYSASYGDMYKGNRSHLEGATSDQSWDNSYIKINKDVRKLESIEQIKNHESTLL